MPYHGIDMKRWCTALVVALLFARGTAETVAIPARYLRWQSVPGASAPPPVAQSRAYSPSDENVANPERGFYHQSTPFWLGTKKSRLEASSLSAYRLEGITLLRAYYVIDEFRDVPLSREALGEIAVDFDAVRRAGVKIIPRFTYNFPTNSDYTEAVDAPLKRVLGHIDQLTPILRANSDVIAFMEAGFAGAWGEWHSSSNGLLDKDHSLNDRSLAIVERLLKAVPDTRMIALRYPYHKQQLFGLDPLSVDEAFQRSSRARIGAHNDCFASGATDGGTYNPPPAYSQPILALKKYLSDDNRWVPQGGEACGADDGADIPVQPYAHCGNALSDLAMMRWSTMNIDYNPEVIELWKQEACFEQIQKRLGYRFRLVDAELPVQAAAGTPAHFRLAITNDGWAAPYNPRRVEIVLRHAVSGRVHRLPVDADPRFWEAGETRAVEADVMLPAGLEPGDYDVLLNLPDPEAKLYARPEYSIRLANVGLWEPSTGFNDLQARLTVLP